MPVYAWACLRVCHSPDGCSPIGIVARSPPLQTQTSARSHTHTMHAALSGPLMCCLWAPSSPVGEVEQQGAKEWWRLEERNADQRETHLQVPSVMLWSGIKLLISVTHPLTHLVHQSPTFSFTQSVTHLLTYTSFTYSLCNNTNKQINKAISDGHSKRRKKRPVCLLQVPLFIICCCRAACRSWSLWTSPISQLSISLAIKAGWVMLLQCVGVHIHISALLHLSSHVRWSK